LAYFNAEVLSYSDYYPFGMLVPNRHGSSNSYRYGFNGKELDNEIKGEGNSYDFGARMYDPRVGRWFKSDPMEMKFPSWSTYSYSANNPIFYIDPNGEEPIPVTSRQFIAFANKLGIYGNKRIGEFYERLVMGSLAANITAVHNTSINFPSDVRAKMNIKTGGLPASVRPDGIDMTRVGHYLPGADTPGEVPEMILSPHFYEAKATSATITKKYRKGQITGMVDAVADLKKKRGERATLTLITTSNTKISKDIKEYAAQRGVYLMQSIAAIDDETGDFVISDPKWVNITQMTSPAEKGHHPSDGVGWLLTKILEMFIGGDDPYRTYDAVDPKAYTKGLPKATSTTDPDQAEVEDK